MPADSSTSEPDGGDRIAARHHRTALFYGDEAFARIRRGRVMVIGLGGVGGHAAVNLARSGVGMLHLVDFDSITASSLNRSPYAMPADLGRLKTDALAAHLLRACPDTEVAVTRAFCAEDTLPELLPPGEPTVDVVIDAIDSLHPKVSLLAWCHEQRLPVLASMGAAGKRDVGAVRTGDIAQTSVCPLARHVRTRLRRRGVTKGIPCVWSIEAAVAERPGAAGELDEATDPGTPAEPDRGRQRHTLASQMTLPGVFGYGLAAMALDLLITPQERSR